MFTNETHAGRITAAIRGGKMRSRTLTLAAMTVAALTMTIEASAQQMIKLDAPGSGTGAYQGTQSTAINSLGTITGYLTDTSYGTHGFVRTPDGQFTDFDAPGANPAVGCTCPTAINDLGVVAGYFTDTNGLNHGFLRRPEGKFTPFDVPGAGANGTFPMGLNLEGAVVGYALDSNDLFHAFLRTPDGKVHAFVGPGSCDTGTSTGCYGNEATAINFWGISIGNFMDNSGNFVGHGLIRHPDGTLTTFEVPGAGTATDQGTGCPGCASGLNQWGAIAGTYTDSNTVHHGFLRSPNGKFTTFDAPGAGTGSYEGTGCYSDCPTSLNDSGAIMGTYIDSNFMYHGYLRTPDGKILTVDPSGSVFTWSSGMNDSGVITGYYADSNNVYHGFLRMPKPAMGEQ